MGVENHGSGGIALKNIENQLAIPIFIGNVDLLKFFKSTCPYGHLMPFIFLKLCKKSVCIPGYKGYNEG